MPLSLLQLLEIGSPVPSNCNNAPVALSLQDILQPCSNDFMRNLCGASVRMWAPTAHLLHRSDTVRSLS